MLKQRPVGRGYNYGVFMCKMAPGGGIQWIIC